MKSLSVTLRGIQGCLILALVTMPCFAASPLVFNQLGFLPNGSKIVVVPNVEAGAFYLVDQSNNTEMLRGPLSQPQKWDPANQTVKVADFTAFNKVGTYRVRVPGLRDSEPFTIAEHIYDPLITSVAQSFSYHRAGAPLASRFAGDFARPSIFSDLLVSTTGAVVAAKSNEYAAFPRGWFNGADYGKSVIANVAALAGILHAFKDDPQYFNQLKLNIPESDPLRADVLAEARWALQWLLSMQDQNDGGVYHAVATYLGKGESANDSTGRALMLKSTAATLQFAAVMALASRVSAITGSGLQADKSVYEQAALKAWKWAQKNPQQLYVQPAQFYDFPYASADENLQDEWFWAAAELWTLTSNKDIFKALKIPKTLRAGVWQHVEMWGIFALIENTKTPAAMKQSLNTLLTQTCETAATALWQSGYLVPMAEADFSFNSNGVAMARAMMLLKANGYTPNKNYEPAARALLDYILGRNPMNQSYVTGFGFRSAKNVVHPISSSQKVPIPGLLVAGPNAGASERCEYSPKVKAMAYIDNKCSVETNGVSLDRQGVLLYVVSQLRNAVVE